MIQWNQISGDATIPHYVKVLNLYMLPYIGILMMKRTFWDILNTYSQKCALEIHYRYNVSLYDVLNANF
jgi:hypothetical protein